MDVRTSANPAVRGVGDRLDRFNARHPWSHNDHYHGWILAHLPLARGRALDVGCGTGALVGRLRDHFQEIVGVDPDAAMVRTATARFASDPEVIVRQESFAETTGDYDLITMVASLHHQGLEQALSHARALLRPGGRLLVVGLARVASPRDLALDLASAAANPIVGLAKHPRPEETSTPYDPAMPVRDPAESFDEIAAVARRVLPGARLRRRLFFRYTLLWERPA